MNKPTEDRQQRIETMKKLVRQLHEGAAEEEVRRQLETLLDKADYADVFQMEMQLIEEGIPQESIQKLCDAHTRVLSGHLDRQETPETQPGHPVHTFLKENRELARRIQQIRSLMEEVEGLEEGEDALPVMRKITGALYDLMEVENHYRRKEHLLFPYLEKKDITGPPAVMWGKHDEIREGLQEAVQGLQGLKELPADEARAYNARTVSKAVTAVEDMIYKEEKILFPTALDTLSEQEWYQVYLESPEIGYSLYVPGEEWEPEDIQPAEMLGAAGENGRVRMPSGSFKMDELLSLFSTLPVDLTFVDQDDTVRYFSPGKDRVFERTRADLGRKVQNCHPPKSLHTVLRILRDFKSGAQDRARFWIQMGPRKIYIVYYALRDEEGSYLGTLEVTQDITEIQKLEGERRLLQYDQEAD